jgi:type I restriction enzyme S subunit
MELKRGYKQTEVGIIPIDWEIFQIKDIAVYRRGSFPQPYGLSKWYDDINGSPFIQVFDVGKNGKLKDETKRKISILAQEQSVFAKKGTLVLTIQGSIGRMAITQYDAFVDRTLLIFEYYKKPIDVTFFSLIIETLFRKEEKYAPGGIIKTITKEALNSFFLSIPPSIVEQTAIATALSDMDNLIAGLEQLIEKKKALKQGAMQELLRPKEGWVVKKFGDVGSINGGGTPSSFINEYWNGNINWFTPTEVGSSKYLFESERKITKAGLNNSSAKILPQGTVLLTTRAGIGDVGILHCEASTNQGFQSIVVNDENDNEFIYYLLTTLEQELMKNASGSTFLEISPGKLKNIEVCIPNKSDQKLIAVILSDLDREIEALKKSLEKYKLIKQGMMQELLTGKTRLIH